MRNTKITEAGLDLLNGLLTYDPAQRLTAEQVRLHVIAAPQRLALKAFGFSQLVWFAGLQALEHPYFKERPLPKDPSQFPTWPSKAEGASRYEGMRPAR